MKKNLIITILIGVILLLGLKILYLQHYVTIKVDNNTLLVYTSEKNQNGFFKMYIPATKYNDKYFECIRKLEVTYKGNDLFITDFGDYWIFEKANNNLLNRITPVKVDYDVAEELIKHNNL